MARKGKGRTGRRGKKRFSGVFFSLVSFVVICAAIIFGMSVFFEIENFEVTGAEKYTTDQVVLVSQLKTGDNLFFFHKFAITDRLKSEMPYISEVNIRRKLPNTIVFEVTETSAVAYFVSGGSGVLIDESGKVLEKSPVLEHPDLAQIKNFEPKTAIVGEFFTVDDKISEKKLIELLKKLKEYDILKDISEINLQNLYNVSMRYDGRYTIVLGDMNDIERKMRLFTQVLPKVSDYVSASIDLTGENSAVVSAE